MAVSISCAKTRVIDDCIIDVPCGFWYGIIQGFLAPITFIISLYDSSIKIYEVNNNGAWYDFGFLIGIVVMIKGIHININYNR